MWFLVSFIFSMYIYIQVLNDFEVGDDVSLDPFRRRWKSENRSCAAAAAAVVLLIFVKR